MASTPGHHQEITVLGDIVKVLRHPAGMIRAVIVQVTLAERLEIAILSDCWPQGICGGVRIFVKGYLAQESTPYKRATHFISARLIEVIPRRRNVPSAAQVDACSMSRQEEIPA
jgi:hypothetical protein